MLTLEHAPQSFELSGVCICAGVAAQALAFVFGLESTASGFRRSIMAPTRLRKKSGMLIGKEAEFPRVARQPAPRVQIAEELRCSANEAERTV